MENSMEINSCRNLQGLQRRGPNHWNSALHRCRGTGLRTTGNDLGLPVYDEEHH